MRRDEASEAMIHQVAPGFGHALLAPMVAHVFQELRISAAVWEHGVYFEGGLFRMVTQ